MAQRTLNRRSRTRRDEDEEEQGYEPTQGYEDDDDPPRRRGRSRRSEPEDDEEPRRARFRGPSREEESPARSTGKGWKAFKEKREETSDYVKFYKLPEDQKEIIKILDEEPFSVYAEHWLDEKQGKKSYVCLGDDCPLCNAGEKPRVYALFNVLDLRDGEDPKVYPWRVSQTVTDVLQGYDEDPKTSPLNRTDLYFSIQKTGGGKKGRVQTNLNPVKARDLLEDWNIEPFSDKELDEFELFSEDDVLEFTSRKTLKAIADDLL